MRLHIALNGNDIEKYHLVALDGTLNTFMKPAGFKKAVTNENAAADGTQVLSAPRLRKRANQSLNLMFLLKSTSLVDLPREIAAIEQELINGKDNTGINYFYVHELDTTYKLYYDGMNTYENFGLEGSAIISLKFTEYNPAQRL